MFHIKTLQQRFVLYMLLPVALLLWGMGAIGFVYARNTLIRQWEEAATLKLQRAAHNVDMRLARPKEWIKLYLAFVEGHHHPMRMRQQILEELKQTEGVVAVNIETLVEGIQNEAERQRHFRDKWIAPDDSKGMAFMRRQMMAGTSTTSAAAATSCPVTIRIHPIEPCPSLQKQWPITAMLRSR